LGPVFPVFIKKSRTVKERRTLLQLNRKIQHQIFIQHGGLMGDQTITVERIRETK